MEESRTIMLRDIVILKQFVEKGFRQDFFLPEEVDTMKNIHQKMRHVIEDVNTKQKAQLKSNDS